VRGQQLTRLISMLRAEVRRSPNVSVGVDDVEILKALLQRTQETLYDEYDWPFLRRVFPKMMLSAGQRYYDFPDEMNFDRLEKVVCWYGGMPKPIERGIGFDDYLIFDSDIGTRSNPLLKWDIRDVEGAEQIEAWPIPADSQQSLQFIGIRKLGRLVDGNDTVDLDDQLIVLFAAAEILASQEAPDAKLKMAAAQARFARLKGRSKTGESNCRIGMGSSGDMNYPGRITVRIGGRH
jgi:hypothetical protein